MRRTPLLFAASLIGLACSDATQPPAAVFLLPPMTFATSSLETPAGPAVDVYCDSGNVDIEGSGHFDSITVTQADTGGNASLCGNLTFNGRVRTFDATFATNSINNPDENPYKYWWRRTRSSQTGGTDTVVSLWQTSAAAGVVVSTGPLDMPLLGQYDALGAILIITNQGNLQPTDSAFLDASWRPATSEYGKINHRSQLWRDIPAPTLDSVRVRGDTAELWWHNGFRATGRLIDSTIIYRDTGPLTHVGSGTTNYSDTTASTGTHAYRLKHFTSRVMVGGAGGIQAFPNSPSSAVESVYVGNLAPTAGFSVSCQQLPCSFTDTSDDPDGTLATWRWTFGDGDSSSQQNPSHTYGAGGSYSVRLIVTDNDGAADTTTGTAAPLQVFIAGPTVVKPKVTCEWDAQPHGGSGSPSYAWWVGGQVVGTEDYLYRYTGVFPFQITLILQSGDGQVDTASVSVTLSSGASSCVLFR